MSSEVGLNILGISAFFHDAAAVLLCDGHIVAAAQEERFSRVKGDASFPIAASNYCLQEGNIRVADVEQVVFYEKPLLKFDRLLETYNRVAPDGWGSFREALPLWAGSRLAIAEDIRSNLGPRFRGSLSFAEHHESHGASAFFPSPFESAAILTIDAVGEWTTTSIAVGNGNRIQGVEEMHFPDSIGLLYSAITSFVGFRVNSGEYKLMGLAPYGKPRYTELILRELVEITEDGSFAVNMDYLQYDRESDMTNAAFETLFGGAPRQPEARITQREMDIAASVQEVCELAVLNLAHRAQRLTNEDNLVMAGGVALNCVANGRLARESPFERFWIQPAAGDAGGALGACLLQWHHVMDKPRKLESPDAQRGSFLGPSYSNEDITLFLDGEGIAYESFDNEDALLERVVGMLEEGQVIGWFQGRMEYGPRALGARSIIGDARRPEMQALMNLKIKYRESFRPFAPSVLKDHASSIFDMAKLTESPYMLFVAPLWPKLRSQLGDDDMELMRDSDLRVRISVPRSELPAITHVDYSARVQTVDAERHGRYYRLMKRFHESSGCPVLINTSFNIRGEPIVNTPAEALRCFLSTAMDALILEDHIVIKPEGFTITEDEIEGFRSQHPLD